MENAWIEVVKTVMPGKRLPTAGEVDLEAFGELFGRLQAFAKLFDGEIEVAPEVQAEAEAFVKHAKSRPQTRALKARQKVLAMDFKTRVAATNEAVPQLMAAAFASSHEDALKFQRGYQRGLTLGRDDLVSGVAFERHTRTFYVLALYWRSFSRCRSLAEIHRHLCKAVGEQKIGSFKTFENNVAKKIGLTVAPPGRPSKKKKSP